VTDRLIELRFPSDPTRLKLVRRTVAATAELCGFSEETTEILVLAVDEALQNVIRHAYHGRNDQEIRLDLLRENGSFVVLVSDHAELIDPEKVKPRDLEDIRPGGLGTHFIRQAMDEVEFLPSPNGIGNLLRMRKHIG
jgi:sigma-B regulation protein RsbU (phosphoserine phosphatase)